MLNFKLKFSFSSFLLLFLNGSLFAQQSVILNQSSFNPFVLNPAAIGLNNDITANCHYKKNWLGLSESPEAMQLTVDGHIKKNKYALGINLLNEKAGIFSKTYFSGAFRYKVKLNKEHHVLFGISAGFQRQLSDFSKIKADSPDEFSQWPQQQAATVPDASFGIIYNFRKLAIMVSANQLLQQNYAYNEPVYNKELSYKTVSQFVLSIQNTIVLKPDVWSYTPQLILRTPQGLPVQFDFVNTLNYKNKFLAGFGYRYYYAMYSHLGFHITENLRVIYSYEYSLGIQNIVKGGHEIGLTFGLINKPSKNRKEDEGVGQRSIDEIFEKLDKHDQEIEVLTKKVDSLDQNVGLLKREIDLLKSKQVDEGELTKALENYLGKHENKNNLINKPDSLGSTSNGEKPDRMSKAGKYKVISPKTEKDYLNYTDSLNANYKIVLGVYQLADYAKGYQKFLQRELGYHSRLLQLNDHPKKYIYVCLTDEFTDLEKALGELKLIRKTVKSKSVEITKGEAWILQTEIK